MKRTLPRDGPSPKESSWRGLGSPGPKRGELGPKTKNKFFEDNSHGIWNLANPRAPWGGSLEGASDEHKAKSGGLFSCQNRGVLGPLASTGQFAPGRNWCEKLLGNRV